MRTTLHATLLPVLTILLTCSLVSARTARVVGLPDGGIQPQAATGRDGTIHLVYFKGDPMAGDLYYARYVKGAFQKPIRVNDLPGSAMAVGSVRGAHVALGQDDRVHVAWMGAQAEDPAEPRAMYYTRLAASGTTFEPQKNVISEAYGLDGGGSVAADGRGNVYVAWHAGHEEATRRVYVAHSENGGESFAHEVAVSDSSAGACGCCGMRAAAGEDGTLYALYRTARDVVHRDMHLVTVSDGVSTSEVELDTWEIGGCPMSTAFLLPTPGGILAAWETDGQVSAGWRRAGEKSGTGDLKPTGEAGKRKHPVVARNAGRETLLAWTEGTGWKRGGRLAWQVFDGDGRPMDEPRYSDGVPVWGLVAVGVTRAGDFVIFH